MACRLMGTERQGPAARELALKVKRALRDQVGECITCSIGLAPNVFLGKVGSDLQKPDGLVVITKDHLPEVLLGLALQDIYGIGERMEQRLHRAGIFTVAQLWNATPFQLRRVWSGINGLLFHQMLHGVDIQASSSRFSKSIGHQHVLEPELRTTKGAHEFAQHLLTKAAERLRRGDYYCRRLGLHLSWVADLGGCWDEITFQEIRDTGFLQNRLSPLMPAGAPSRQAVGVRMAARGSSKLSTEQKALRYVIVRGCRVGFEICRYPDTSANQIARRAPAITTRVPGSDCRRRSAPK
jgi:DNA polymerase-4